MGTPDKTTAQAIEEPTADIDAGGDDKPAEQQSVADMLADGIRGDGESQSEPDEEPPDADPPPAADPPADEPDEKDAKPPAVDGPPAAAKPADGSDEENDDAESEEDKQKRDLSHRLARKRHKKADQRETELAEREQQIVARQQQFQQQQEQFFTALRTNPMQALEAIGVDANLVVSQASQKILGGDAPEPQPWEGAFKQVLGEVQKLRQEREQSTRDAAEQQRKAEFAGHYNAVVGRMVNGPEMKDFEGRWPTFAKLSPQHREREARECLAIAYKQGFEGQIDELLDELEITVADDYPYLAKAGNGADPANASGRDGDPDDTDEDIPPGNGSRGQKDRKPAAAPDAVTGDMTAENGSRKGRRLSERQRRAAATKMISDGIID